MRKIEYSLITPTMKRKFEELRENLAEFVQQDDDDPTLVVGCLSEALAHVLKFLQALGEKRPQHHIVVFPRPYEENAARYFDSVVESICLQVEAAASLRAEQGAAPFPRLLPALSDTQRAPVQQLLDILDYMRSLYLDEVDYRMVVGLLPLSCEDAESCMRLMLAKERRGRASRREWSTRCYLYRSTYSIRSVAYACRSSGSAAIRTGTTVGTTSIDLTSSRAEESLGLDRADLPLSSDAR